ncbi:metallophosphoesterase family protein [Rubritalea profundi]|uniref:Calcineurin-like phosphoesterase domain-containing protein n=1 Tax=Rubritalea profundi TaxID=1658618 RepID=A0A2S7U4W3_9BACT|nr:hypothetical protein [Rubritalea profundi]PQJ30059.1 hypothetical protein BSZ32_17295 [Rubritalea profundi]
MKNYLWCNFLAHFPVAVTLFLFASSLLAEDSAQIKTSAEKQAPFSFVQMCDTQLGMGGCEHDVMTFKLAVKQINAMKPDFVVICGDLVQKANDKSFADFKAIKAGFVLPCHCAAGHTHKQITNEYKGIQLVNGEW